MPELRRFFVEPADLTEDAAVLRDAEAHHALHVLRVKAGERVSLFNGSGLEATGTVAATTRQEVTLAIGERVAHAPPPFALVLLQAWLHRDKAQEDLIRRGTEIGITRFVFFEAQRSERPPRPSDKWRRWAIDACKQCGRVWLPELMCARSLEDALAHVQGALCILSLQGKHQPIAKILTGADATLIVGPEGDFTAGEAAVAQAAGAVPISLGDTVYRAEVAAVLAAALVQYEQGGLGER